MNPLYTNLQIHLADDEWGNRLMQELAEEAIQAFAGPGELVVEVWEHGGWHLTFARIDGKTECVSSANDCATFTQKIKQFWTDYNSAYKWLRIASLKTIRREKKAKVAA